MITVSELERTSKAICAEIDPDLFYPAKGQDAGAAKAVCRSCEARLPCLELALSTGDREGIFGGFSDRPRREIARRVRAGESLEDIIAADDAAFYTRIEVEAANQLAADRRRRERNREQTRLAKVAAS
jgi:WhiB family redox-sensing transcriptional regulator